MNQDKKPLHILLSAYACEPNRGSEPGVGWNWAIALVERGHEVWVLTRANNRKAIESATSSLPEAERVRLHFIYFDLPRWASWWKKGGRGVQLYYALWQRYSLSIARAAHAQHKFDLAHHLTFGVWRQPTQLHKLDVPLLFGPVGGGEGAPKHLVNTLPKKARRWEHVRDVANQLATINPGLRTCLRKARWVVAKTTETAEWLQRAGAKVETKFEIGIDAKRFEPRNEPAASGGLKCLFAGRLIGWKGVHLALEAVAAARAKGGNISLTIVGQGPMRPILEALAVERDVVANIHFIDWLDQRALFEQYRQHDVLLFPSLHDSSGNVILEAFAHALPAVCLKLGGPGEMVDESCGIVVPPTGDAIAGLAEALLRLEADPALRTSLSLNAREKALATTWANVVADVYLPVEATLCRTEHCSSSCSS